MKTHKVSNASTPSSGMLVVEDWSPPVEEEFITSGSEWIPVTPRIQSLLTNRTAQPDSSLSLFTWLASHVVGMCLSLVLIMASAQFVMNMHPTVVLLSAVQQLDRDASNGDFGKLDADQAFVDKMVVQRKEEVKAEKPWDPQTTFLRLVKWKQ